MNPSIPESQRWIAKDVIFNTHQRRTGNLDDVIPYTGVTDISAINVKKLTQFGNITIPVEKDGFSAEYKYFNYNK